MQEKVAKFHKLIKHRDCAAPISAYDIKHHLYNTLLSRIGMMQEELSEYARAMAASDTVGAVDALADLLVFLLGTCCFHGVDIEKVFDIVMEANFNKANKCMVCHGRGSVTGNEGMLVCTAAGCVEGLIIKYAADGKVLKPEDWVSPEAAILEELKRQGLEVA